MSLRKSGARALLAWTNASFVGKGRSIQPAYLERLARSYDAGVYLADFVGDPEGARKSINDWVLERTEQRIDELLPASSIYSDVVFVLVNAISFKASWLHKFDPALTE